MVAPNQINAMPTKAFFVDMIVKDIPLERAVLDLVDNCIDGARRLRPGDEPDFTGLQVEIELNKDRFEIRDNCGGFDIETAQTYAFRFGRPLEARSTAYSIGQFGVGMKRALFKFGSYFEVYSTTRDQKWSMKVDVDNWEEQNDWVFDFDAVTENQDFPQEDWGTRIIVERLRPEVASKFSAPYFHRQLNAMIRSHQRQFLAWKLAITLNGAYLTNTRLQIRTGDKFKAAIEEFSFYEDSEDPIGVRVIAGVSDSSPSHAGWYIVCNGRVVMSGDRSEETGWGSVADQKDGIPKYHNQYARFRGVAFFDCRSSSKLPWNTTKTGLDASSAIWLATVPKMLDHTRTVINFLNDLDNDVEEFGQSSPLLSALNSETTLKEVESLRGPSAFSWDPAPRPPGPRTTKIQYSREADKIGTLMTALNVRSAKAVGEATFDLIYRRQNAEDE